MKIVIGLGNPGKSYVYTRHNIGFLLLDYISIENNFPFSESKGDYCFWKGPLWGYEILFVKPTTYMNNSGLVLDEIEDHFSEIDWQEMLVVYDDYHLPFGQIRLRKKGSDAGHNGIKSMLYHAGTEYFPRLKLGIGEPTGEIKDFVLSRFTPPERDDLPKIIKEASLAVQSWVVDGIDTASNNHNKNILTPTR